MKSVPCTVLRDRLSLSEAVLLAEVSEDRVRKDIERGWLVPKKVDCLGATRIKFHWIDVYAFAAMYNNEILTGKTRSTIYRHINELTKDCYTNDILFCRADVDRFYLSGISKKKLSIHKYLFIDLAEILHDVSPRVDLYAEGLKRIEEKPDVLSGDAVFNGTRLSVKHVGGMLEAGEPMDVILEDYPYLKEADVRFARLYHLAHPALGRPRNVIEKRRHVHFSAR